MEVKQCLRPPRVAVTLKVIGRGEGSGFNKEVGSVLNEPAFKSAPEEVGSSEGVGSASEGAWSVFKGAQLAFHEVGSAPKIVVR